MKEKQKILCLEDSLVIQKLVKKSLEKDYDVFQVENGQDGILKLRETEKRGELFNLFITDINMPIMSGPEFIKEVKQIKLYRHVPIIIITSDNQAPYKHKVMFNAWLNKPFTKDEINLVVDKILNPLKYLKN